MSTSPAYSCQTRQPPPQTSIMSKFGLVLPAKKGHITPARSFTPKTSIFSNEDDDLSDSEKLQAELQAVQNASLKKSEMVQQQAVEVDPSVFDYDGVYESIKADELKKRKQRDGNVNGEKKARYMETIISSSNRRNIEIERAKERMAQRERLKEPEELQKLDKFVTSGFKRRQLELQKLEELEKLKEEEDEKRRQKDPLGFYRSLLHANETPANDSSIIVTDDFKNGDIEKEDKVKKLVEDGKVLVNDSNEIVDKRQLLSVGVNISSKKRLQLEREKELIKSHELDRVKKQEEEEAKRVAAEKAARQRKLALKHVEEQRLIKEKEEKEKREKEKQEVVQKMARRTTEDTVSEARKRYLERKKLMEQEDD